jgi:serine/threonine-protein kinase PknK
VSAPVQLGIAGLEDAIEIGRGGFAAVYRARQPAFGRNVAVKVLMVHLDDKARDRFARECQAMGALSEHPAIVTIHDAGFDPTGRPYLVMTLMPGGSLEDRLAREGPLAWPDVVTIGVRIADALATAHEHGIIHRDVKPANLLVSRFGDVMLSDFGIARIAGGPETRTGSVTASLAHAPPEVIDGGRPTERSDVYSLASSLFTLIRGRPPFAEPTDETALVMIRRILEAPTPDLRLSGVPDAVCAVLERSLAKDPDDRHPSAAAFGAELRAAAPTGPIAHAPTPPPWVATTPPPSTAPPVTGPAPAAVTPPPFAAPPAPPGPPMPARPDPERTTVVVPLAPAAGARPDPGVTPTPPVSPVPTPPTATPLVTPPGTTTETTPGGALPPVGPAPSPPPRRRRTRLFVAALVVVVVLLAVAGAVALLGGDDGEDDSGGGGGDIAVGDEVDGSIDEHGEVDQYVLDAPGEGVVIKVLGEGGGFDPLLRLVDEDGEVFAEDDDSFGGTEDHDPILDLELPDGVVTIEVSAYADETIGDYTLVIEPWE